MAVVAQILIALDDTGNVQVTAQVPNRLITCGLLEVARDVLKTRFDDEQRRVRPATPGELGAIRPPGAGSS